MKNVKTAIWDLDGTAWFAKEDEANIICKKLNIENEERFRYEYYRMWQNILNYLKDKIVTYNEIKEFIQSQIPILKEYNISVDEILEIIFKQKSELVVVNEEALELMKYLSKKGIKNISITDAFSEYQRNVAKELNLLTYMSEIYGCENGYTKNSNNKISQVIKELNLNQRKQEYVMIGDSLSSDISFANKLGIKCIWYNRHNKINNTTNIPNLEVSSLSELKDVF